VLRAILTDFERDFQAQGRATRHAAYTRRGRAIVVTRRSRPGAPPGSHVDHRALAAVR